MRVTLNDAATNLSELIDAALAGEEVIVALDNRRSVKLVPIPHRPFKIGILKAGVLGAGPDFQQPMDDEERAGWGET